jgi:hypothetical protein
MKKTVQFIFIISLLLMSCENSKKGKYPSKLKSNSIKNENKVSEKTSPNSISNDEITEFVPKEFNVFEKIKGDLNNDGIDDYVIVIKAINKKNIIIDEYRGELDRNRRGIIVLLYENGVYKQFLKNVNCFSSENEDGGVYFQPELYINIEKGKLFIHFGHGRYGYWKYTFRLKNSDLELIGYDSSSNNGPVIVSETSINFLTNRKIEKINTNRNANSGEEVFEEINVNLKAKPLLKFSKIEDFDDLELLELK